LTQRTADDDKNADEARQTNERAIEDAETAATEDDEDEVYTRPTAPERNEATSFIIYL
jgi:hypothetical protein